MTNDEKKKYWVKFMAARLSSLDLPLHLTTGERTDEIVWAAIDADCAIQELKNRFSEEENLPF